VYTNHCLCFLLYYNMGAQGVQRPKSAKNEQARAASSKCESSSSMESASGAV